MGLAPVAAFDTAAVTMRPFSPDVPPRSRGHAPKAGIEPTDTWARTRLVTITTRDCDVRQAGVEPATSSFSVRRSPG